MIWYLAKYKQIDGQYKQILSIDNAYELVKSKRPITEDRRTWLVQPTQPEEKTNV